VSQLHAKAKLQGDAILLARCTRLMRQYCLNPDEVQKPQSIWAFERMK
jgi:hypothetical protein